MALTQDELNQITDAIQQGFKSVGGAGTGTNFIDAFNTKINRGSNLLDGFFSVLDSGGGSVTGAFMNLTKVTDRIAIPGITLLGKASVGTVKYLEDTQSVFNDLSKIGGGVNGRLMQLRGMAADARLSLSDFSDVVKQNSTLLVGLGGTVNDGTKQVAELGKALFDSQMVDEFLRMGFTVKEATDFVVKNTAMQNRTSIARQGNETRAVANAAAFAKNLQIISRLTGKQVGAIQDELIARQRAGSTQAALRLLEKDGVEGAQEAYSKAQQELSKGPKVLQELFDDVLKTGVPLTEATRNFAATNSEAYALLQQAAEANKRGDVVESERLAAQAAEKAAEFAQSRQGLTLATLGDISDIAKTQANALEEMSPLIDAINANYLTLDKNATSAISFSEKYNKVFENQLKLAEQQLKGQIEGTESLETLNMVLKFLANTASGTNKQIADLLNGPAMREVFSSLIDQGANLGPELTEKIKQGLSFDEASIAKLRESGELSPEVIDSLKTIEDSASTITEERQAYQDLVKQGFLSDDNFDGNALKVKIESISDSIDMQGATLLNQMGGSIPTVGGKTLFEDIYDTVTEKFGLRATGGPVNSGNPYMVGEKGPELFVPRVSGNIKPNSQLGSNIDLTSLETKLENLNKTLSQQTNNNQSKKMDDLNSSLQQLIEINRKTANSSKQYVDMMRGSLNGY